jgi:general secretion pathway protein E
VLKVFHAGGQDIEIVYNLTGKTPHPLFDTQVAVRSSMTGHFVLSTLHTNSAVGSVTRMIDMGVERYLLAPMVVGLVAQRLVRKLCQACKTEDKASEADSLLLAGAIKPGETLYRPNGCAACHGEGYRGREGLYEVVAVDDAFQKRIHDGASEAELEAAARLTSPSLMDDGIAKIRAGLTTVEEVARVVRDEG